MKTELIEAFVLWRNLAPELRMMKLKEFFFFCKNLKTTGCYGPKWNTTYLYKTSNCFLMFFGRASEFPVPFSFPFSRKLHLQVSFPKPSQTKALGQREQLESVCLPPRYSIRHGPIIYGSQSTSSTVHYVHYALKHLSFPLVYSLVGVSYSHHI